MKFFLPLFLFLPILALANPVLWIEIKGAIDPGSADYLMGALQKADDNNAAVLVLQLDTPGGLLSSTRDIIEKIAAAKTPLVIYVSPSGASATSAGALISLAAPIVAMAPGTTIGAAHPVGSAGEDIKGAMAEKVTNDTAALARSQALLHERDPKIAEQIVEKSRSLSSDEAVKGRIVDFIARDKEDLFRQLQGRRIKIGNDSKTLQLDHFPNVAPEMISMSLKQIFLHTIAHPNISAALLALGGLAIYVEIAGGFSVIFPGIFGAFCLILGAISLQMLPVNTGGVLLLALGFGLLIGEAFLYSHGLLTISGLAALAVGAVFLVDPSASAAKVSLAIILPTLMGVGTVMLVIITVIRKQSHVHQLDPLLAQWGKVQSIQSDELGGTIFVNGELWSFQSHEKVSVGEECKIVSRKSMILKIERKS